MSPARVLAGRCSARRAVVTPPHEVRTDSRGYSSVRPTCVRCCYTVRRTAIHIAFASGRFARDAGLGVIEKASGMADAYPTVPLTANPTSVLQS